MQTDMDDKTHDNRLARILAGEPVDTASISRAVLGRLASERSGRHAAPLGLGAGPLMAPLPLGLAVGSGLGIAAVVGYAAIPVFMGRDLPVLLLLAELAYLAGGS